MPKRRRRRRHPQQHRPVAESTAVLDRPVQRTGVREATTGGAHTTSPGRIMARLIQAGWSLNGNYYPPAVLERDGPQAWPAGTLCFADHATEEEDEQRPSGSVRNLAGVLTENARWDPDTQSLVAEVRLFAPWRESITDMADTIGMSIRAWVTGDDGEAEGRTGFVVESIPQGRSVDFVTVAAAGGAIVSVLEAAGQRPASEARNVGCWLESRLHLALTQLGDEMYGDGRLTRAERITLSSAIGEALQAWTARVETDAPQLFARDLWDEPDDDSTDEPGMAEEVAPVRPVTAVENVTGGAPPHVPNQEEEPAMSGTHTGAPPEQAGTQATADTTTESADARQDMRTVAALEAVTAQLAAMQEQLTAVTARADQQDAENRSLRRRQQAGETVAAVLRRPDLTDVAAAIGPRVTARVLAGIPTCADGTVDAAALTAVVDETVADEAGYVRGQRAAALEQAGLGVPRGLGGTSAQESDGLDDELAEFFAGSLGMSSEAAKIAAKGRV